VGGGTYRYVTATGAVASLTFTGDSIEWIGEQGPNYGRARVTITNSKVCPSSAPCQIELYSATAKSQALVSSLTRLGAGQLTIKIRPLHTKNGKSMGFRVAVDAFSGPITTTGTSVQVEPELEDNRCGDSSWLFWILPLGMIGFVNVRRRKLTHS
jgi:hypothetical protein